MINTKKVVQSLWILLIFFVFCACQNQDFGHPGTTTEISETTLPIYERQKADFDFLKKGISYEEVVARVGKEEKDIGSGSYILEYNLMNGSRVYLQFISLRSLERAYIVYREGTIENIIAP